MNENFMKERPVFQLIVSMSLPMVISMLVNSLYNIVDSFFVAKISDNAMTALSLIFPVQNFINAIAVGFGIGINAITAFYLGSENKEGANQSVTNGIAFCVLHGILATVISILIMPKFLRMFTDIEEIVELGVQYSTIAFSFSLIIMLGITFEKVFQAVGRMKVSMASMMCGCITNIILDPLLIFGIGFFPEMGIRGAALATGIGQAVSFVIYAAVYFMRPLPIQINRRYFTTDKKLCARLYAIGIPATLNMALPSLLISCLNALLSVYSQSYVVILGVYYKLQTFLYLPANGIVQGIRPIIGFNYGANEMKRVKKVYDITLLMSAAIMAAGTCICLGWAKQLMGLFIDNPQTIQDGQTALRIISAGFLVSAVSVTSSGALEGLGKGTQSLMISLCRYIIIILPAAFILSRIFGPVGVWNAFWVTEFISAGIAYFIYRKSI